MRKLTLIAICLFVTISYLGLGKNYLFDWDEGIYAVLGREMYQTKELLSPTWNNELWVEKPPTIAWVTSLGMTIAGETELGARLFMPIFAGLALLSVFLIGERLGGVLMGGASMAILGYFNLFLSRTRTVNTDIMLLTSISWTVWLLIAGSPSWLVGIVMGLAIMAKGPAGILAILITVPLLIKKSKKFILLMIGACLLVITPWHLYAYLVHGQSFITPYLLEQVLRRATVPIEFHTESRWFYLAFLYKDLGIGILLAALLGIVLMQTRKLHLVIWWILVPLVLFTLAKTRLSWYILPVYPALALSIGYALASFAKVKQSKAVVSILVFGMLAQLLYHAYQYVDPGRPPSPLSSPLQVASSLSTYPGQDLAMLVAPSERVAQAILPASQTISSSFRYGGSPSVVWYSRKHVLYYYNYDHFKSASIENSAITTLIVTAADLDKVPPGFVQVAVNGDYHGFVREATYALR